MYLSSSHHKLFHSRLLPLLSLSSSSSILHWCLLQCTLLMLDWSQPKFAFESDVTGMCLYVRVCVHVQIKLQMEFSYIYKTYFRLDQPICCIVEVSKSITHGKLLHDSCEMKNIRSVKKEKKQTHFHIWNILSLSMWETFHLEKIFYLLSGKIRCLLLKWWMAKFDLLLGFVAKFLVEKHLWPRLPVYDRMFISKFW